MATAHEDRAGRPYFEPSLIRHFGHDLEVIGGLLPACWCRHRSRLSSDEDSRSRLAVVDAYAIRSTK